MFWFSWYISCRAWKLENMMFHLPLPSGSIKLREIFIPIRFIHENWWISWSLCWEVHETSREFGETLLLLQLFLLTFYAGPWWMGALQSTDFKVHYSTLFIEYLWVLANNLIMDIVHSVDEYNFALFHCWQLTVVSFVNRTMNRNFHMDFKMGFCIDSCSLSPPGNLCGILHGCPHGFPSVVDQ